MKERNAIRGKHGAFDEMVASVQASSKLIEAILRLLHNPSLRTVRSSEVQITEPMHYPITDEARCPAL